MIFKIEVRETSSRIVEIEAESSEQAIDFVRNDYENEKIVLDAEDFEDYEFFDQTEELAEFGDTL